MALTLRIIAGVVGSLLAVSTVLGAVGLYLGYQKWAAENGREFDFGMLAPLLAGPCFLAAISLFCLRFAFRRPND
jgi:hypothetical protein